jgi:cytoskeletal protein RodZ
MNQINVNPSREPVDVVDTSGDRSAAAGINLITVLIVLAVLAVIAWYLFTGPLHVGGSSSTTVNVQNPAPTVQVNVPSQSNNAPAPGTTNNTGTSSNTGTTSGGSTGTSGGNNPPANP